MVWDLHKELRVNQAGEYGAKRIYEGQLSVLTKNEDIAQMLKQELKHLQYFDEQLRKNRIRPTLLQPLWHVGGFVMGKVTAMMGEKAAMACTVAVEDVISQHYQEQISALESLDGVEELRSKITQFRNEEIEHHDHGILKGAEDALGYRALRTVISGITRGAIFLSKRL